MMGRACERKQPDIRKRMCSCFLMQRAHCVRRCRRVFRLSSAEPWQARKEFASGGEGLEAVVKRLGCEEANRIDEAGLFMELCDQPRKQFYAGRTTSRRAPPHPSSQAR